MSGLKKIAIAGIHTDIGKTVVSALLCQALQADYWKPVQAGSLQSSDRMLVQSLLDNPISKVHPEALQFRLAASPHTAAAAEQVHFDCRRLSFPETANLLLVETAGGLLSPMDQDHTMADFILHFDMPAILVTRNYLGSINHTLLCIEVMRQRGINLLALVINGNRDAGTEDFIKNYSKINNVFYTSELTTLNPIQVKEEALLLRRQLQQSIPQLFAGQPAAFSADI
jgi:dethiobiotin synthetase